MLWEREKDAEAEKHLRLASASAPGPGNLTRPSVSFSKRRVERGRPRQCSGVRRGFAPKSFCNG
jgi:hypothetical protein